MPDDATQEAYRRGYRDGYRDGREDRATSMPDPIPDLACPDCGEPMKMRTSKHGPFYGCSTYPDCRGTVSCGKDGQIKGTPADAETRAARRRAHEHFDRLWKSGPLESRAAAYRWLREIMELSEEEAHISKFDKHQCERVIRRSKAELRHKGLSVVKPPNA